MRKIVSLFLLLISQVSSAQDYSGMYPGAMHFYSVNNGNKITSIREDSSYFNGPEFIRYPELNLRDVQNENIADSNCMFWGAPYCIYKIDSPTLLGVKSINSNNKIKYFNFSGDSLMVRFDIAILDTQTVYSDSLEIVRYICLTKDTTTLFGQPDSMIVFQVLHTDTIGNPIGSAIQGMQIKYSKNCGLVEGFAFDYFPQTITLITLEGIRNPDYGFNGMTYAEVYDFQIGDVYEIYVNTQGGPTYLKEIVNRTDISTEVQYSIYQILRTSYWTGTTWAFDYDTSIVQENYSKLNFIDEFYYDHKGYKKDTSIFNGCYAAISYEGNNYNTCMNYCPGQNCLGNADCFMWTFVYETYLAGAGITYGNYNTIGGGWAWKSLTYLNKQGMECGSSTVLSNKESEIQNSVILFPNPSSDYLTIQSDQPFQNATIQLTDLSGRVIAIQNFNQTVRLDISDLPSGIFLVKIISADQTLSVQKFIKE